MFHRSAAKYSVALFNSSVRYHHWFADDVDLGIHLIAGDDGFYIETNNEDILHGPYHSVEVLKTVAALLL